MNKNMENEVHIKILVIGESDVGKSCFVNLICTGKPLLDSRSTIGCNIEITGYDYNNTYYLIELWEIGGRIKYQNSRSIFNDNVDGVIFVHDLSNKRSMTVETWLNDLFFKKEDSQDPSSYLSYEEMVNQLPFPIIIVGNKSDLITNDELSHIEEMGISNINLSSMEINEIKSNYTQSTIKMFFEKCIITKLSKVNNNGDNGY